MNVDLSPQVGERLLWSLNAMRDRIIRNMQAAGQVVTGKTAESIKVEQYAPNAARITARPYFAALETGSKPWTNIHMKERKDGSEYPSAPGWFVDIIADWLNRKGLSFSAWAVATKIMSKGSALYLSGGRRDIFTNEIEATKEEIGASIGQLYMKTVRDIMDAGQYRNTFPNQ